MDDLICIGCPVHIKRVSGTNREWVGYVRRIDWNQRIAEIGPETCLGSHLRVHPFEDLVPASFTPRMHRMLPIEIDRLKQASWSEIGSKGEE